MDEFDKVDLSLINEIGSEIFNDIIFGLSKIIKYFYIERNDHNLYNNFIKGLENRDPKILKLYDLYLPYINIEIRNIRISKILDN